MRSIIYGDSKWVYLSIPIVSGTGNVSSGIHSMEGSFPAIIIKTILLSDIY